MYNQELFMSQDCLELNMTELDESQDILFEITDDQAFPQSMITGLSNNDYSLNSPLIEDEIIEFKKYLLTGETNKRWPRQIWESRKRALGSHVLNHDTLHRIQFHKQFGSFNLNHKPDTHEFNTFLIECIKDSHETKIIPDSFIRGWIGERYIPNKQYNFDSNMMKWGTYFWELHRVTLALNAKTLFEIQQLDLGPTKKHKWTDTTKGVSFILPNFGYILVTEGFVLFKDLKLLIDRNCLLMMKDTYAARFHTLISMCSRTDDKFKQEDIHKMHKIYQYGDILLESAGSDAYTALKLIEPICNLRLTDLARQYRDKIPEFPRFKNHLNRTVRDLPYFLIKFELIKSLIMEENSVDMILTIYGSFRHWGHPFIDYISGLKALHDQVTMKKDIDTEYASKLASDLAFKVLKKKYHETKTWFVDPNQMESSPLREIIEHGLWPTPAVIANFGDNWHKLPLRKCFDIPDVVDPSLIYSDKSHSIQRSEIIEHLKGPKADSPIQSRKVLSTLLAREATDWPQFLQRINDVGLSLESLVIGLKAKEREQKVKGRFFSLMSWELRDYFVFTEYLIKTHFVPLFDGLTMADDLTTVTQKMLGSSSGQGNDDYKTITIANHIDYEKWNNHQRGEANNPVFEVMGHFLGYPNLIKRTHEFFEKSLIYYGDRADLMMLRDGQITNRTSEIVCWNGQPGGLEGLRQKGWSITNLLVIEREARQRNTEVQTLAQGDNQVICTKYKPRVSTTDQELTENIHQIIRNNNNIMKNIEIGTTKLGLIINNDETMQSADYLNYGKTPVFRGNIRGLETKRWSRVTCATNDQLPTLGNLMATVTSNALTVSHYSPSCINSIYHMNFLGAFIRRIISYHDPSLQTAPRNLLDNAKELDSTNFKILSLYLDPSLGGVSGTSLTRFLIRGFPDPITEGLTFWKIVHDNCSDNNVKALCAKIGSPRIVPFEPQHISKLAEDPQSLNIPRGISAQTMIKEEIKKALILNRNRIKNEIIRSILDYITKAESSLWTLLESIRPRFPRFISEFRASTFSGLSNELIGLFQNSRTIRNQFKTKFSERVNYVIVKSELLSFKSLISYNNKPSTYTMWTCSSTHADTLRKRSWGFDLIGTTIPHAMEMIPIGLKVASPCQPCNAADMTNQYLAVHLPAGLINYEIKRGPCAPYLGSKTAESTSILTPWEKETKIPLIKRAAKLRNAINWFIDPTSNLASIIYNNLKSLTGEDWSSKVTEYRRTGSALHRFASSRQTTGGYAAQSPAKLTWINSTTNTLSDIGDKNYDFLFQSLLLYSQVTVGELHDRNPNQGCYHFHLNCLSCLREIEEPKLDTEMVFKFEDMSQLLNKWKPETIPWCRIRTPVQLIEGDWDNLTGSHKSYHIGRAEGFVFGTSILSKTDQVERANLFPLTFKGKVCPIHYMKGILDGLVRSSVIEIVNKRHVMYRIKPRESLMGSISHLIQKIGQSPSLTTLWRTDEFLTLFSSSKHHIPSSYPLKDQDLGSLGVSYLRNLLHNNEQYQKWSPQDTDRVWIFADLNTKKWIGLFGISTKLMPILCQVSLKRDAFIRMRELKDLISNILTMELSGEEPNIDNLCSQLILVPREVRHAVKSDSYQFVVDNLKLIKSDKSEWGKEYVCWVTSVDVHYSDVKETSLEPCNIPRITNPTVAGLRTFQCATGSHYKVRGILKYFDIKPYDVLCGADGSGGVSSMILREYPDTRLIYNSLLNMAGVSLRGSNPSPPTAIYECEHVRNRCVNLKDVWQNPSDLCLSETWRYFRSLIKKYSLRLNLMVFDMESIPDEKMKRIEMHIIDNLDMIKKQNSCIIFKTYLSYIHNQEENILTRLGCLFKMVNLAYTEVTSSHSSETYVVMQYLRTDQYIKKNIQRRRLISDTLSWPVSQSIESEMKRARILMRKDLMIGVPQSLRIDPVIELGNLLRGIGVKSGIAYSLMELSRYKPRVDPSVHALVIYLIALNSLFDVVTEWNHSISIPSDENVLHIGALYVGFMLWYCHALNLVRGVRQCHAILNGVFTFNWSKICTKNNRYRQQSSLYKKSKDFKYLRLLNESSLIAKIIRLFHLIFPEIKCITSTVELDSYLSVFNKSMYHDLISQRTGLVSDVLNEVSIPGATATAGFDMEKVPEQQVYSWRS